MGGSSISVTWGELEPPQGCLCLSVHLPFKGQFPQMMDTNRASSPCREQTAAHGQDVLVPFRSGAWEPERVQVAGPNLAPSTSVLRTAGVTKPFPCPQEARPALGMFLL